MEIKIKRIITVKRFSKGTNTAAIPGYINNSVTLCTIKFLLYIFMKARGRVIAKTYNGRYFEAGKKEVIVIPRAIATTKKNQTLRIISDFNLVNKKSKQIAITKAIIME